MADCTKKVQPAATDCTKNGMAGAVRFELTTKVLETHVSTIYSICLGYFYTIYCVKFANLTQAIRYVDVSTDLNYYLNIHFQCDSRKKNKGATDIFQSVAPLFFLLFV